MADVWHKALHARFKRTYFRLLIFVVPSFSFIMPFECVCNVLFELVKNIKNVVLFVANEQRTKPTAYSLTVCTYICVPHTYDVYVRM